MNACTLFVVGITGSIGCGKSAVTKMLAGHGARLLDADQIAREVIAPGSAGFHAVINHFGTDILLGTGPWHTRTLDRFKLAERIFKNPAERQNLERIIHPRIHQRLREILLSWQQEATVGSTVMVAVEMPLLFESGWEILCDLTVTVACGSQQWDRLAERQGMSNTTKQTVIDQQMPEPEKCRRADRVIHNQGSVDETAGQVTNLWEDMRILAQAPGARAWPNHWDLSFFNSIRL